MSEHKLTDWDHRCIAGCKLVVNDCLVGLLGGRVKGGSDQRRGGREGGGELSEGRGVIILNEARMIHSLWITRYMTILAHPHCDEVAKQADGDSSAIAPVALKHDVWYNAILEGGTTLVD